MDERMDSEREAFEKWMCDVHMYAPDDLIWQAKRNCYADHATHLAWQAWQAAHLAQPAQAIAVGWTKPQVVRCFERWASARQLCIDKTEAGYDEAYTRAMWSAYSDAADDLSAKNSFSAQPAQAVDVGAIREVAAELTAWPAPDRVIMADKLTRALSGENAGPVDGLADRIRLKLPTIRARTGNPLFDAGTHDACEKIAALLPASPAPDKEGEV